MVSARQGRRRRLPRQAAGLAVAVGVSLVAGVSSTADAAGSQDGESASYLGHVEVVRDAGARSHRPDTIRGTVYHDRDRDSRSDRREPGVAGVPVSNGREVVKTDRDGGYELPAYEGMTVFVTKPNGWEVPLDGQNFPQFFYHHLPQGSPPLRFDGLPPTGPLPQAVNFPLVPARRTADRTINCAVVGDPQTYSNQEIGYLRDGLMTDLEKRRDLGECGALIVGDVAGDDLGLYPRIKEVLSLADVPVRAVPGNHDIDYDATEDEHSFDTYKREIGPEYYSYDVGKTHFVGLDNVKYPCTPEDDADGDHDFCDDPADHPSYTGVIGEQQLTWLANDLAHVPKDKLVVIATHIPLVSFLDQDFVKHQTDDVKRLYQLLEGREALSVSGHTQVVENLTPGDSYAGWQELLDLDTVPFRHLTVGAASGSWWTGDLSTAGSNSGIIPETLQREGGPPGYMDLELKGSTYRTTYRATGQPVTDQMDLSVNSPFFRTWYDTLSAWNTQQAELPERDFRAVPPVNVNDLGDLNLLTAQDLAGTSYLTANVWAGETGTRVSVQIDGRSPVTAERSQAADGEGLLEGAEYGDPLALTRQLQVGRYALESTSGNERAQGWEAYRGEKFGPGPAQPIEWDLLADQSSHLWRLPLPTDLPVGAHTATVRATDPSGRRSVETLNFEVLEQRPTPFFRSELFPEEG